MATLAQQRARAYKTISGNSPKVTYFPEAVVDTFKKGALVYLTASGTVRTMVNVSVETDANFDQIRKRLVGIALKDATYALSASGAQSIPVHVCDGDTLFIGNVISRTSAATAVLALANIGQAVSASVNASRTYVDVTGSLAASTMRCMELIDAVGDTYGRVLWQLLPGARIFG